MIKKNYYKKIFIIAAALFVLFAPVGMTTNSITPNSGTAQSSSNHFAFSGRLALNLALASNTSPTAPTGSQSPSLTDCVSGSIATCSVYFIAFIANMFISVLVALGAYLIQLGLQFNDNVFYSPAVQIGFSVTLALANLGFVLGIIVIAIATIIRNQTYGIKQLLWKLVVMAILVNFGLVITAPIVGFASSMSNYFINASSPSAATGGYIGYATTITQAFSPQSINVNGGGGSATNTTGATVCAGLLGAVSPGLSGLCSFVGKQVLGPPDIFAQQVNAMFFGIIFSSLTAFTFLCLAVLLVVRYLMLAGLLIVLPLAWLTYIIPSYDNNFSKWWTNFIKWTLFPPLALFFIYLALITATNVSGVNGGASYSTNYAATAAGLPANAAAGPAGTLATQTGLASPIQQAADEVLLVGLTIMGLMFASSLAGKAGSTVVNTATTASKAVGNYVGKQGKKTARFAYQKADKTVRNTSGKGITQRLQEGAIPGLKYVPFGRRAASLAGRGVSNIQTNEDLVKEAQKNAPHNWEEAKHNLAGSMNTQDQFAHIAVGIKEGKIKRDDMVNGKRVDDFLDNEDLIARYGQGKLVADANKIFMSTTDSRNAERAISNSKDAYNKAAKGGKPMEEALAAYDEAAVVKVSKDIKDESGNIIFAKGSQGNAERVNEAAMKEFLSGISKSDASKIDPNSLFGPGVMKSADGLERAQRAIRQIADYAPQIVPNLVKGMKGPTVDSFGKKYNETLDELTKKYEDEGDVVKVAKLEKARNAFKKNITNSLFGSADRGDGGGGGDKKDGGEDKKDH